MLILPGGNRGGSGFSCQVAAETPEEARAMYRELVTVLRDVANQIERDIGGPLELTRPS